MLCLCQKKCNKEDYISKKKPQDKYIFCCKGKIIDVVVDARKNSKTYGNTIKYFSDEKNGTSLFIPEGFLHGFGG